MVYALVWFVVVSLLGVWSLAAWALHAAGAWTVSAAGSLGGAADGAGRLQLPKWIARSLPNDVTQALAALTDRLEPAVQTALRAAPALADGLSAAVWVAWAVGCALLAVAGVTVHALIAAVRRRTRRAATPSLVDAR